MKTPKSNTHTFKVLQWMKKGLSITSWQAIDEFRMHQIGGCNLPTEKRIRVDYQGRDDLSGQSSRKDREDSKV